ncbi:hypothetical protein PCASD_07986 [Puccinia coronata f. sp. avenae]|uniref:CxC1-like cysteine cluster associated with KDZ transposases domain-containing protein n=1 Tax=Puccinia coronata f. sp. avenae TaxID=200324 RepID=A0A2N5UNV0_9BASI|nr:hypothetical protein PCASD_07986 [Puccinia coronata f. sp. avenae]
MELKARTNNWTDNNWYEDFSTCRCGPLEMRKRMVDLIDINGQQRTEFTFCSCNKDTSRLLCCGFLPASPITPQTAFSLPLLIFHNHLWNNCHVSALPFTVALNEWLEPRSQRLYAQKKRYARDLRKPFSAAVDLYRKLENMTNKLVMKALRLSPQEIQAAQTCPACFGPRPPNIERYPIETRDKLIICLDGNFQHRHHAKASRNYQPLEIPRIFVPQRHFDDMRSLIRAKEIELAPPAKADRCTDAHKAADDKKNESTWQGCDDTGLMGCCCRHDAAVYMGNIYRSGELRSLPLGLIVQLLSECEPERQIGVLYDIGCSLHKFIRARNLLPDDSHRIKFGTSVFHAYVHNWLCQLDYHPRLNSGWGLSDGEGLERLWSYLSPLVSPLWYSTRNHRLGAIAHRLKHHNTKGIKSLPTWLKRKFRSALNRRNDARSVLAGLYDTRNPHVTPAANYTNDFFISEWTAQRKFQAGHTEAEQERRAKLVKLYKQEAALENLRIRLLGPEVFLADDDQLTKLLDNITEHTHKLREQLDELTGEHNMRGVINDEESKLLLLLWDAKAELFVHAVHTQAEKQPITDSRGGGCRVGTKLKEKIYKAIQGRKPAVKKHIDSFNRTFATYVARFPDQTLSDAADYPLTYEKFMGFSLDHRFWNDGLYYHSKAPWAIDPEVRAGITATIKLGRVQEEFQLIAQELCRLVSWGVSFYNRLDQTIKYLSGRLIRLENTDVAVDPDYIDSIPFGQFSVRHKIKVIKRELRSRLTAHCDLVFTWSENVEWLWSRCQPEGSKSIMESWGEMLNQIAQGNPISPDVLEGVREDMESVQVDVNWDDGEDANEDLVASLNQAELNSNHDGDESEADEE